jgi:hypothetical protein
MQGISIQKVAKAYVYGFDSNCYYKKQLFSEYTDVITMSTLIISF